MLDFLFFFFMIFGYKIGLLDLSVLVTGGILLFLIFIQNISITHLPRILVDFIIIFSLIITISCISFLLNNGDFLTEFLLKPIRVILLMFFLYVYIKIRKLDFLYIMKILVFVFFIHSIVIYLQYIFYYLDIDKSFLYHPSLTWSSAFRKVGLTTGFPSAGLILVFGSILSLFIFYLTKTKKYAVIFLIMSLSIFVTARSAMYIYILLIPLYMLILSYSYRRYTFIICYIAFIIFTIFIVYFYLVDIIPSMQGTINKMFANIINYMKTGNFHDYSSRHLISSDHLYFVKTVKEFFIGNSLGKSSGFQPSDIGYVRITTGIGIFAMLLYLLAYLLLFINSIKKADSLEYPNMKILLILIYIAFFIMSLKSDYMFSRIVGDSITIISFAYIFAKNKSLKSNYV